MNNIINIEGLNVLYTEIYHDTIPLFIALMGITFFVAIAVGGIFYIVYWDGMSAKKKILTILSILIVFISLISLFSHWGKNDYLVYYVSFEEDCKITEVTEEYKIIDNKGALYLLVDNDSKIYTEPEL